MSCLLTTNVHATIYSVKQRAWIFPAGILTTPRIKSRIFTLFEKKNQVRYITILFYFYHRKNIFMKTSILFFILSLLKRIHQILKMMRQEVQMISLWMIMIILWNVPIATCNQNKNLKTYLHTILMQDSPYSIEKDKITLWYKKKVKSSIRTRSSNIVIHMLGAKCNYPAPP